MSNAIKEILRAHGDPDVIVEYERECADAALLAAYVFLDAPTCSPEHAVARKLVLSALVEICAACGRPASAHCDISFIYASPVGESEKVKLCERCWFDGDAAPTWAANIRQCITERRAGRYSRSHD